MAFIIVVLLLSWVSLTQANYCNDCPNTMMFENGKCEKVTYTCKCDCSLGCVYQTSNVNRGFIVKSLDIEHVNTLFDVCDSCYTFWSTWICTIDNPSYHKNNSNYIDICDVSLDYEQMSNNCLVSPTPSSSVFMTSEEKALEFLEKDVILRMLRISEEFRPAYLWTWVNHTKADVNDVVYMMQVKEQLYDSWRDFQVTGHGAIELGIFHYPNTLADAPFGQESWPADEQNSMYLKMNIDEYLDLVTYVKNIVNKVPTSPSQLLSPSMNSSAPSPRSSPNMSKSPSLRSVVSNKNDTRIDIGDGIAFALAWWAITIIVVGGVILLGLLICLIMCCVRCCR